MRSRLILRFEGSRGVIRSRHVHPWCGHLGLLPREPFDSGVRQRGGIDEIGGPLTRTIASPRVSLDVADRKLSHTGRPGVPSAST